jgi:endonuclease/exonuclease/phosphatase (EEP) superfamily protein YafD
MVERPAAFEALRAELGLDGAREGRAIDHLLARGLRCTSPAAPLPDARRELSEPDGRLLRLSDHAPVVATYDVGFAPTTTGGG